MQNEGDFTKQLRRFDTISLAFGAIIGWGWVIMSGTWITEAGTIGAMLAFVFGGLMVYFVGLVYAELTPALPKCGGEHIFSLRALGWNGSYVCTWMLVLGYVGVSSFEACAFPSVFEYVFSGYLQGYLYEIAGYKIYVTYLVVGVGAAILVTYLNYVGIKQSARFQNAMTIIIACTGVLIIITALFCGDIRNIKPFFQNGMGGVFSVAVMTPFLFVGFDVIPQAVEEIDMPAKSISRVMILSILLALIFYLMVILSVSMIMTQEEINASYLVTADAIKKAFRGRQIGAILVAIGGMAGILSSWNSFVVGSSRCIYAMANTGMLPAALGKLHKKHETPHRAVLLVGFFSMIAPFFGKSMLTWLSNSASFAMVIAYFLVSVSFLVLRKKEPELPRPYKVSCGTAVGTGAVLLTLCMFSLYMPGMPSGLIKQEWVIIGIWVVLGLFMYRKAPKESSGTCTKT